MAMVFDDDNCGDGVGFIWRRNTRRSVGPTMMLRKARKVNPSAEGSDDNMLSSVVSK